jgi:hypothetical protein
MFRGRSQFWEPSSRIQWHYICVTEQPKIWRRILVHFIYSFIYLLLFIILYFSILLHSYLIICMYNYRLRCNFYSLFSKFHNVKLSPCPSITNLQHTAAQTQLNGMFAIHTRYPLQQQPGQLSRYSDGLRPGIDSWQGQEVFLYSTVPRPALGPIQSPIQWAPGALSPGVKRPRCEADQCQGQEWCSYIFTPLYIFMTYNFTFLPTPIYGTQSSQEHTHRCNNTQQSPKHGK